MFATFSDAAETTCYALSVWQVLHIPREMALRPDGGILNLASQQVRLGIGTAGPPAAVCALS